MTQQSSDVVAHVCSYNAECVLPKFFDFYDKLDPKPDHTVFVINNCTDETYRMLAEWDGTPKTIVALWFVSDIIARCRSEYAALAIARQLAWDYVKRLDYGYAWQLDDDMLIRTPDAIEVFKGWDLDVVGGSYCRDFPEGRFLTAKWLTPDRKSKMFPEVFAPMMWPTVVGGGCMFMKRKVFIDPRCYVWPLLGAAAEDFGFGMRIADAGYSVGLDGLVEIGHLVVHQRRTKPWTKRDDMLDFKFK